MKAPRSEVFLDSLDYISWSDTLIKIFVPSFDSAVISGTAYTGLPAGTGFFRIVTDNGEIDTSHTKLKINFSVANDDTKKAFIIAPRKIFNKKITFHCSHAVGNFKGGIMKAVIRKSLADWTCLTGIDWELGNDTTYTDTIAKNDSICIITFATLGGNTLAQAIGRKGVCPIPGNPAIYYEMDIEIDTNNLLHIDTSSAPIPAGYFDFYSIILHELGHSHNLKHVIEINNVMHYGIAPNVKKRDLEHDWSCDEGGNWVIDFSTDTINNLINNCNLRNIKANPSPPCSHVSIKEIGNNLSNITLYPNPFTENLNISFNSINNEKIEIRLYDITGKLILNKDYSISTGNNSINVNTTDLSGGVYVINIQNSGVLQSFKLIKYGN